MSVPTRDPGGEPPRLARGMAKRFLIGSALIIGLTTIAISATVLLQVGQLLDEFNQGSAK